MASTYLSLVNSVLIRLRESTVTSVSATPYSLLIGALVNDAKREVEDAWQWSQLQDFIQFPTVSGTYKYELANINTGIRGIPAGDRARLWVDPVTSHTYLINTTPSFENNLIYEPTLNDQASKVAEINQNSLDIPKYWQLFPSATTTTGQWNKQARLYAIPNGIYTMQMWIVNPTVDMVNDTDYCLVPSAPIILKSYLFALYERGEELGEMLTLTTNKVEESLASAISYDQSNSATYMALTVPVGGQY